MTSGAKISIWGNAFDIGRSAGVSHETIAAAVAANIGEIVFDEDGFAIPFPDGHDLCAADIVDADEVMGR